jgi:DNA-binding GntR family transcriptional regulator
MEARLVLEQFAAEKVVRRGPAAAATVFERLSAELERLRNAGPQPDVHDLLESDRAFHTAILEDADNPILAGLYASLRDRQMRMTGESAIRDPQRITTILHEHRAIAEALRDCDLDRVREAVKIHLAGTVRALGLAVGPTSPFGDGSTQ